MPTHMGELDALQALVDADRRRASVGSTSSSTTPPTRSTQPLGAFTPEAWEKSFDVNLRGPVFLVQAALPHLKESPHGAVVNVISAGAFLRLGARADVLGGQGRRCMAFTRAMAARVRAASASG